MVNNCMVNITEERGEILMKQFSKWTEKNQHDKLIHLINNEEPLYKQQNTRKARQQSTRITVSTFNLQQIHIYHLTAQQTAQSYPKRAAILSPRGRHYPEILSLRFSLQYVTQCIHIVQYSIGKGVPYDMTFPLFPCQCRLYDILSCGMIFHLVVSSYHGMRISRWYTILQPPM